MVTMGDLQNSSYGYAEVAPALSDGGAPAPPAQDGSLVVAERTPVSDDTDVDALTKTTIGKMCEYIKASAVDPHVQGAAQFAAQKFGRGINDPYSFAWGVFWFLKHRVRRVLDEGNMFRVGEPSASDMLIAPSVLLRMQDPAEDCDGFTMAAAAMLAALGVTQCIVTVACDPQDAQRWSHVFGMVQLASGDWLPLDCSHGRAPGWMVPGSRITRWQAWDLDGNQIDVPMPQRSVLKGYVRRGMGQGCDPTDPTCAPAIVGSGIVSAGGIPAGDSGNPCDPTSVTYNLETCLGINTGAAPTSTTPIITSSGVQQVSSGTGINWGSLISQLGAEATKVASIAELPAGSSLTSSGAVVSSIASSLGGLMPIILLGLGAWVLVSMMESSGRR